MKKLAIAVWRLPVMVIKFCIRCYQKFLNPVLHFFGGPMAGCRFTPSCSNYCMEAVETHGAVKGSWLGLRRICRCHPWGGCGHDPVPPKKQISKTETY